MVFMRIEVHSPIRLTTSTQVITEERSQLPMDFKAVTCQAFTKAWKKQHVELHLSSHPHNIRREDIISQAYERFQGSCKSQSVYFQVKGSNTAPDTVTFCLLSHHWTC
ncbi:hypothetical protein Q3G72_012961 [Acer saccharum]|nr:hypothetical protein Q3G72_012961 [Acer saccharum]